MNWRDNAHESFTKVFVVKEETKILPDWGYRDLFFKQLNVNRVFISTFVHNVQTLYMKGCSRNINLILISLLS